MNSLSQRALVSTQVEMTSFLLWLPSPHLGRKWSLRPRWGEGLGERGRYDELAFDPLHPVTDISKRDSKLEMPRITGSGHRSARRPERIERSTSSLSSKKPPLPQPLSPEFDASSTCVKFGGEGSQSKETAE